MQFVTVRPICFFAGLHETTGREVNPVGIKPAGTPLVVCAPLSETSKKVLVQTQEGHLAVVWSSLVTEKKEEKKDNAD